MFCALYAETPVDRKGERVVNWKIEATEKLRKYDAMRRAMENIPAEIARLEEEHKAVGSGLVEWLPGSKDVHRREDWLLNNLVNRQELQHNLDQAKVWMDTVSCALMGLEQEERLVLHQLYIDPQGEGLEGLCKKLQVEKSSIYRRRDRALEKFTRAMYGATESN